MSNTSLIRITAAAGTNLARDFLLDYSHNNHQRKSFTKINPVFTHVVVAGSELSRIVQYSPTAAFKISLGLVSVPIVTDLSYKSVMDNSAW